MNGSTTHPRREQLEDRLRAALDAKAHSVDINDLRPAFPPPQPARPRFPARRVALLGLGLVIGLAAVAASVLLIAVGHEPFEPNEPARPSQSQSQSQSQSHSESPTTPVAGERSPSPSATVTETSGPR
ncbi:hypothetical protein ACFOZ0_25390 [Streptomyces yaanensis]|uniref:DUF3040 domain-containing protein n=1 Tax=Streptomyces yaanensis TaxID=1142239 RepID=A0ABV7SHW8_9ACTN|nr:hypothetical protein [Streptomyces sp. CGMCC 4.7035]WNC01524.1 hypothetical protein Q2K21_27595 [Streptomyces sp. CGMCC 4.7035]